MQDPTPIPEVSRPRRGTPLTPAATAPMAPTLPLPLAHPRKAPDGGGAIMPLAPILQVPRRRNLQRPAATNWMTPSNRLPLADLDGRGAKGVVSPKPLLPPVLALDTRGHGPSVTHIAVAAQTRSAEGAAIPHPAPRSAVPLPFASTQPMTRA